MEVLVCHRVPEVAEGLAALLATDPRVRNADSASGGENVLAAVTNKQYDIQIIGAASVEVCHDIIVTVARENRVVHVPRYRVLLGLNPPAEIISRAVRMGYHALIDLAEDPGNIVDRILSQIATPHNTSDASGAVSCTWLRTGMMEAHHFRQDSSLLQVHPSCRSRRDSSVAKDAVRRPRDHRPNSVVRTRHQRHDRGLVGGCQALSPGHSRVPGVQGHRLQVVRGHWE